MLANSKSSENKGGKDGIEMIKPYLSKIFEDVYDLKYVQSGASGKEIVSIISLVPAADSSIIFCSSIMAIAPSVCFN